jgi:hypothetical protein
MMATVVAVATPAIADGDMLCRCNLLSLLDRCRHHQMDHHQSRGR